MIQCLQHEPSLKIKVRVLRILKHSSFTSLLSYLVPELNLYHDDKLNPRASGVLHMELILHNSETSVEYDEFHLANCFKIWYFGSYLFQRFLYLIKEKEIFLYSISMFVIIFAIRGLKIIQNNSCNNFFIDGIPSYIGFKLVYNSFPDVSILKNCWKHQNWCDSYCQGQ